MQVVKREGGKRAKDETLLIAARKWKVPEEKLLGGASVVWLEGEVEKEESAKEVVPKVKLDVTNSR